MPTLKFKIMKKTFDLNSFPFGKHIGQPIETVKNDKRYAKWLCKQEWFQRVFKPFYELLADVKEEQIEKAEPSYYYTVHDMKFVNKKDILTCVRLIKDEHVDKPICGYELQFLKHFFSANTQYQPADILEVFVYRTSRTNTAFKMVVLDGVRFKTVNLSIQKTLKNIHSNNVLKIELLDL